jgi:DNA topoisomerase I
VSAIGAIREPAEAARAAALRHVNDSQPGIQRRRSGRGFGYVDPTGTSVRDKGTLARIRALAIPPAWTDVWICPLPNGHLQATGRDARRRKQYRYHARWRDVRDAAKYERLMLFGSALPRIREHVERDLARPGLPREKILATIVRLLETTFIRVGNEEYARTNGSFGLTTLENRHVRVEGDTLRFRFRGKSGKTHSIDVNDRRLARLVKRCRELPGQDLFQYLDEAGQVQGVNSADVNEYVRAAAGDEFTAKDFRTWAGTLLAARCLNHPDGEESSPSAKSVVTRAVESVARQLGNTPAICRKCYIHPAVLSAFQEPAILAIWQEAATGDVSSVGMNPEERALLRFLEQQTVDGRR